MKRLLLICLLGIAMTANANAQETKNLVYDANAEVRTVESFKGIEITGANTVYISQGKEIALAVSGGGGNVNTIKTDVINGILKISGNGKAYITVKTLESLRITGASSVRIADKINSDAIDLELSGASSLKGEINIKNVQVKLTGSSSINVTGKSTNATIEVSGVSSVKSFDWSIDNCKVGVSGVSSVNVSVNKELDADASGTSKITYKGNPSVKQNSTGISSVRKKED